MVSSAHDSTDGLVAPPGGFFDVDGEPETSLSPIHEVSYADREQLHDAQSAGRPLVVRGYHQHDPCMKLWSFAGFKERTHDHLVDVDVGNAMVTPGGLHFEQVSLHHYLDTIAHERVDGEPVRYLQAYHLGQHIAGIYDEIDFPFLRNNAVRRTTRIWFGPAGTITGYHDDVSDNQLSQVVGRKLVKLISPDQAEFVYRRNDKYDPNGHVCAIDVDNWDVETHPKFALAKAEWTVIGPGDTLFIPANWAHYVRSLDASISVNCLGYTPRQILTNKVGDLRRRWLHNTVFRKRECTCHMWVDNRRLARR